MKMTRFDLFHERFTAFVHRVFHCFAQENHQGAMKWLLKKNKATSFLFSNKRRRARCKNTGMCLGLALSKRILGLMGGKIGTESETGNGSRFSFTVPLSISKRGTTKPSFAPLERGNVESCLPMILISTLRLPPPCLSRRDSQSTRWKVEQAVYAFAAAPERYDAILIDVQMPEMGGLQATTHRYGST